MIPANSTLVQFQDPVADGSSKRAKSVSGPPSKLPPVDGKKEKKANDILNQILPPKVWTEDGVAYTQMVSDTPATRLDVIKLQERLDVKLKQRQARETGICPIRRELYGQVFDELIRHVTINCAERGLLLLRIRDEIQMTIAAYQTLYESSVSFGMRKALQAEQGKMDLEKRLLELEADKSGLEGQVVALKARCDEIEKRGVEQREVEKQKHEEAFEFMKRQKEQLKTQLESMLAPSKK